MNELLLNLFHTVELSGSYETDCVLFTASFDPDPIVGMTIRDADDKIIYFHEGDRYMHDGQRYMMSFNTEELKQIASKMAHWADMDNQGMRECIVRTP
jgi:hypothetical protein